MGAQRGGEMQTDMRRPGRQRRSNQRAGGVLLKNAMGHAKTYLGAVKTTSMAPEHERGRVVEAQNKKLETKKGPR